MEVKKLNQAHVVLTAGLPLGILIKTRELSEVLCKLLLARNKKEFKAPLNSLVWYLTSMLSLSGM